MICYQTDRDGYYLHPTQATLDPEETKIRGEDVWTLPAGGVEKAPPAPKKDCRLRYVDGKWVNEPIPEPEPVAEPAADERTAVQKLADFVRQNPDVKSLIGL